MKYFGTNLSEKHKELNKIIRNSDKIQDAKKLFFEIHSDLHLSEVYQMNYNAVDELIDDLLDNEYRIMPTSKDETIAWILWHIARIEDVTMGILVAEEKQVFSKEWKERINTDIIDTGNAMIDDEIMDFSKKVNIKELLKYRNAVGKRTSEIVKGICSEKMTMRVDKNNLDRILLEGGVTQDKGSFELLEFWGKKDIAGLLLMPPTRHELMHLNNCYRLKESIRSRKKFFRN